MGKLKDFALGLVLLAIGVAGVFPGLPCQPPSGGP